MKKTAKFPLLLASVLLTVGLSHNAFASGNAGNRPIKKLIHPNKTRVLVVADNQNWLNPDSCDKSNQVVLAAGQLASDKIFREMLAMLLSAQIAGRRVELRTTDCININGISYPVITQVTLL